MSFVSSSDFLTARVKAFFSSVPKLILLMPHLMAYAVRNPAFGRAWRAQAIDPPRLQVIALLNRAISEGRLAPGVDVESAAIGLVGPMMYRNMLRLTGGQQLDHLAEAVVETLWQAYGRTARRAVRSRR